MNQPNKNEEKLLELIRREARAMAEQVYDEMGTKYGVADVPTHMHNGVDSVQIPPSAITAAFVPLPATSGGVANPTQLGASAVINDSSQASNPKQAGLQNRAGAIYVNPIPIIYGTSTAEFTGGDAPVGTLVAFVNPENIDVQATLWLRAQTTVDFTSVSVSLDGNIPVAGNYTLTGALNIGANSAILSAAWTSASGVYFVTFSSGASDGVTFTNGSTAISWNNDLTLPATNTIFVDGLERDARLVSNWPYASGLFKITFSDASTAQAYFTSGSKVIGQWGLPVTGVTASITVGSTSWYGASMITI